MLLLWAAVSTRPTTEIFARVIENLLVLRRTLDESPALGILWTIHAEVWFYVSAPLLLLALRRTWPNGRVVTTGILLGVGTIALAARVGEWNIPQVPGRLTLLYMDSFALGMLAAIWREYLIVPPALGRFLVGACFAVLLFTYFVTSKGTPYQPWMQFGVSLLCVVIVVGCLSSDILLDNPLVLFIGRISFSMYLLHGIVLQFRWVEPLRDYLRTIGVYHYLGVTARLTMWNRLALFVPLIVCLSYIMYITAERAGIRLGHYFGARANSTASPPDASKDVPLGARSN